VNGKREQVKQDLAEQGIATMIYYPIPQDQLPIYKGKYAANPVSDELANQVLSLPIWSEISLESQEHVAKALRSALV
jgi:dTDP-4-amino-4,6-dideoxygalactose transaminase